MVTISSQDRAVAQPGRISPCLPSEHSLVSLLGTDLAATTLSPNKMIQQMPEEMKFTPRLEAA